MTLCYYNDFDKEMMYMSNNPVLDEILALFRRHKPDEWTLDLSSVSAFPLTGPDVCPTAAIFRGGPRKCLFGNLSLNSGDNKVRVIQWHTDSKVSTQVSLDGHVIHQEESDGSSDLMMEIGRLIGGHSDYKQKQSELENQRAKDRDEDRTKIIKTLRDL